MGQGQGHGEKVAYLRVHVLEGSGRPRPWQGSTAESPRATTSRREKEERRAGAGPSLLEPNTISREAAREFKPLHCTLLAPN